MPKRPPLTPAEQQAQAEQGENDMAALFLVRRAAQIEATAAKAVAAGSPGNAKARQARVTAYRNAATRLVLNDRPASLGVPRWIQGVGDIATIPPLPATAPEGGPPG